MNQCLDINLLSAYASSGAEQADLLHTLKDSLIQDIEALSTQNAVNDLHRLLHTMKGYICYAHRGHAYQLLTHWCNQTRDGHADKLPAFQATLPQLSLELNTLIVEIEAWLNSYHASSH